MRRPAMDIGQFGSFLRWGARGGSSRGTPEGYRQLNVDRLEDRALLSVTPLNLNVIDFQSGPWSSVGRDLATAQYEYQQYLNSNPGEDDIFATSNSSLVTFDGGIVIDAVAADGNTPALLAELESLGLEYGASFGRMVSGWLPLESVDDVPALTTLAYASPFYNPITNVGATDTQGDISMNSDFARQQFDVDGTGVTVGVLSDSFNARGVRLRIRIRGICRR